MPEFQSAKFGELVFDSQIFDQDIVISMGGKAYPRGYRQDNHELTWQELKNYISDNTKKVIVGTGFNKVLKIVPEARDSLAARDIQLLEAGSQEAVLAYNKETDKSHTVAVIHSTC